MNKFQLYLSLVYGVIPYDHFNAKANPALSYLAMYALPLFYLICFGLVRFGPFGLNIQSQCNSICRLANTLFVYLGFSLYLLTHLFTLWRRKQFFIEFEKSLHDIDMHLYRCEKVASSKLSKRESKKLMYYFTWIVVSLCFTAATAYDIREMSHYFGALFFIRLMVSNFPYFASSIVLGQFIYYISEISKRFYMLNEQLESINHESESRHEPVIVFDIENELKSGMSSNQAVRLRHNAYHTAFIGGAGAFNNAKDNYTDDVFVTSKSGSSETNFPDLFKIHDKILSLSELTSNEFGPQCVPYMTVCFVMTIFGIFLQTKVFFVAGGKNRLLDYVVLLYSLWSLATMLVAYLVLRLCCTANSYSKQSAMIVHEIMQKKPAFMLGSDVYYNKMKSFTLQFLHWEGYFQFNGVGLYVLDYTFIFSISLFCIANTCIRQLLMFMPQASKDYWRYLTYMLMHSDVLHLSMNVCLQLVIGFCLESEQGHLKVSCIYVIGGVAGSLATFYLQPQLSLMGASAGVYAMLMSHIPHLLKNFYTLPHRYLRILSLLILFASDMCFTTYHVLGNHNKNPRICLEAHVAGAISGLLFGFPIYSTTSRTLTATTKRRLGSVGEVQL